VNSAHQNYIKSSCVRGSGKASFPSHSSSLLPSTGVHQLRMRELDSRKPDHAPGRCRRLIHAGTQLRLVPGNQPDVYIAVPLLVAICGTGLPNNVLHIPQHNAGFVSDPQVSTQILFPFSGDDSVLYLPTFRRTWLLSICTITQGTTEWLLKAEFRVQSPVTSPQTHGERRGTEAGFSPNSSVAVNIIPMTLSQGLCV
jgi:hypothetical protein